MADISGSLRPTHESFFFSIDPNSLILSQNSISNLTFERGPRYKAYAQLRESKLRLKQNQQQQESPEEPKFTLTPTKKRVTFQESAPVIDRNRMSVLAQSVPDFSAVIRKENRRPASTLEMTPPNSKSSNVTRIGGSKSASGGGGGGEKKGGLMVRKSYASVEDLKGLASGVASAINGEGGGKGVRRSTRGSQKTVLGYRQ